MVGHAATKDDASKRKNEKCVRLTPSRMLVESLVPHSEHEALTALRINSIFLR